MRALLAASFGLVATLAFGQTYPNKPVRIVVPYPAGGTVDAVTRVVAQRLSENLGQQFIVDNRPGASGTLGSKLVATSAPDGYTLLVQASTFVATPMLMSSKTYDIEKDFTAITQLGSVPMLVTAHPGVPARDLKEFMAAIRKEPGKYTFGTSAVGSASHLAEEAIKHESKLQFEIIPYKGTAPALTEVMGGHINAMVDALPSTLPHVKSGKLKPLAVTSAKRIAVLPDVPTVAESGLTGFEMVSWYGLWGPARMPAELTQRIRNEVAKALASEKTVKVLGEYGFSATASQPADFTTYIRQEKARFSTLIREANIKLD
ncbi:Bug family tripartite tricarboxylate transporter substrate binding protein [Cupriavidus lacunae]|uniref:Bug family tripartite tricarboxylate transporter substrate binding protein n=1 Tax=Cupriavidus lacunae TaxID=2666307 RepID=UPI001FC9477D|nr:tripartite tricarboxylate transporter substrate binding protein [Cupriavidus lacunae]